MGCWVEPDNVVLTQVTGLAAELSDPIRLTVMQLLATEGPHTMVQLAKAIGVAAPRLGNHLARLRASGLVDVERHGRHAVYRVARPGVGELLTALSHYALNADLPAVRRPPSADDIAHTCYDHAAGRLGVAVFAMLVRRGALRPPDGRTDAVEVADAAAFARLGVDVAALDPGRRVPAAACLDKAHRLPHLGGATGGAVLDAFVAQDLVRSSEGTRTLTVTAAGRRKLPRLVPGFTLT